MRLLLLEYRNAFAERLARALSEDERTLCDYDDLNGFQVRADSGQLASYDAIVFDLRRDTNSALKLCRRVLQRTSDIPVIAVTAYDNHDEAIRLVQAGVEDVCLRTECEVESLRSRIGCAIERHRANSLVATPLGAGAVAHSGLLTARPVKQRETEPTSDRDRAMQLVSVVLPGLESSSASDLLWSESLGCVVDNTYLADLDELMSTTSTRPVDAVVLYLNEIDPYTLDVMATMKAHKEDLVIVVSAPNLQGHQAVSAIQHGADEVIPLGSPTHQVVARHVRQGLVRRQRLGLQQRVSDGLASYCWRSVEPRCPRYYVTKSAVAIPIRPDLTPDRSVRAEGLVVDVSASGIGFEIGGLSDLPSELLLAGVEGDDGTLYFATVQVRNWQPHQGHLRVGAEFVTTGRDLLKRENLYPTFRPDLLQYAPGLPALVLEQWAELGIFQPMLVDRVFACPTCGGMPAVRSGCRACGSIRVVSYQLLHHYDCSFLGRLSGFGSDGTVICPKCGQSGPANMEEFELLEGPCRCLECNWSDNQPDLVCQCLRCQGRFPLQDAREHELIGYHVNRLDPQTLLGVSL